MEPLLNKLVVQPRPGATFPPSPAPNPFGLPGVVARKHGRFGINRSSAVHGGGNPESKELRVDGETRWSTAESVSLAWQREAQRKRAFTNPNLAVLVDAVRLLPAVAAGEAGARDLQEQLAVAAAAAALHGSTAAQLATFLLVGTGYQAEAVAPATRAEAAAAAAADPLASRLLAHIGRGDRQLLRASLPPSSCSRRHVFGPDAGSWFDFAAQRMFGVNYGEPVPLQAAQQLLDKMRSAGVQDAASIAAVLRSKDSGLRLQLGECGPLGLKSVIPTAREVAAQAPGSLRVVLDHVRASLLLALGSPGADGMFNRLELMLPLFWLLNEGKCAGVFICLAQLLRRFPSMMQQLPVDWLGSHNPADFVVHESGWVLTWDEWAALCPQEHYFSTLAQQLAAEFRTQHPQLRLGGPCAGCERCGTSAVAVAESVGTSFAAGLALTLRSEFAQERVSLRALARFGPPGRPLEDMGQRFPSPRCTPAPRQGRLIGVASALPGLELDAVVEEEEDDEDTEEREEAAQQQAGAVQQQPLQLQLLVQTSVRALSAALSGYDCPASDARHGPTLYLSTWEALCRLYRRGALDEQQQRRVHGLLCEAAAAAVGCTAGELQGKLDAVRHAQAAAAERDWQQRQRRQQQVAAGAVQQPAAQQQAQLVAARAAAPAAAPAAAHLQQGWQQLPPLPLPCTTAYHQWTLPVLPPPRYYGVTLRQRHLHALAFWVQDSPANRGEQAELVGRALAAIAAYWDCPAWTACRSLGMDGTVVRQLLARLRLLAASLGVDVQAAEADAALLAAAQDTLAEAVQ